MVLPMLQAVIDRVNSMAADQPTLITFVDKHDVEIGDDSEESAPPSDAPHKIRGVIADIA